MSWLAVIDRFPAYRHGLCMALSDAGFDVRPTADLLEWASSNDGRVAVFSVRSNSDINDLRLATTRHSDLRVVAIEEQPDRASMRLVFEAGACACLPALSSIQEIVEVVRIAATGRSVLPTDLLWDLINSQVTPDVCPVSPEETDWLRALARGTTIAKLAERACYSEREMYRRLHDIYLRLGVSSRTEAVVLMSRWGLLDQRV